MSARETAKLCSYEVQLRDDLFALCRAASSDEKSAKALMEECVYLNNAPVKRFWVPGKTVVLPRALCLELLKKDMN